jgi:hypothetical protein
MKLSNAACYAIVLAILLAASLCAATSEPARLEQVSVQAASCKHNTSRAKSGSVKVFVDDANVARNVSYSWGSAERLMFHFPSSDGFHHFEILSELGYANPSLDILPGHNRTLFLMLCDSLMHQDSQRSVSLALPARGISGIIESAKRDESVTVHLAFEDLGAYAVGLAEGPLVLKLFDSAGQACRYQLPNVTDWQHQHLRFAVDFGAKNVTAGFGACPKLIPIDD